MKTLESQQELRNSKYKTSDRSAVKKVDYWGSLSSLTSISPWLLEAERGSGIKDERGSSQLWFEKQWKWFQNLSQNMRNKGWIVFYYISLIERCVSNWIVVLVMKGLVTKEWMLRRNEIGGIRYSQHTESVPPATCVWLCKLKVGMCLKA